MRKGAGLRDKPGTLYKKTAATATIRTDVYRRYHFGEFRRKARPPHRTTAERPESSLDCVSEEVRVLLSLISLMVSADVKPHL